jgi:cbb3-type cytochrome oxidase maturation protein
MNSMFLLIPLGLGLFVIAVAAFLWAVRNEQFDDLDTPALRILLDEDPPLPGDDGETNGD